MIYTPIYTFGVPRGSAENMGDILGGVLGFPYIDIVPILGCFRRKSLIFAIDERKVPKYTGLYTGVFVPIWGK